MADGIYLLGDGMLFDEMIANMLTSVANLRVIKRAYEGESAFVTDVSGCRPDVILLTETDRYDSEEMLTLLPGCRFPPICGSLSSA